MTRRHMIGDEWVIDFPAGATVEIFGKQYLGVTQIRYPVNESVITETITCTREEIPSMTTEKRPKLRRTIQRPGDEDIPAGTIGERSLIAIVAWNFGKIGPRFSE